MMAKRERAQQFVTRVLRRGKKKSRSRDTYPFVVAYDTGDAFNDGDELTLDQFYDILQDYEAIIVHWKEGDHPSQKDHYLFYDEAKTINVTDEDVDRVSARKQSREVVGDVSWFKHGTGLAVNRSIGLHCRDRETWEGLP